MSAAAVELQPQDEMLAAGTPAMLRQQAAEVLAAHRSRRERRVAERTEDIQNQQIARSTAVPSRSATIASRVTERYAQTQSYRAFLAAEAEEATRKAKAFAEVAARTAQAVAEAQQELLKELACADTVAAASSFGQRDTPKLVASDRPFAADLFHPATNFHPATDLFEEPPTPLTSVSRAGLTVKLFDDAGQALPDLSPKTRPFADSRLLPRADNSFAMGDAEETLALDEEISFRQSPSFDLEGASVSIPGNLLEFPRQLVAARRARPRYAEGPLCEEGEQGHDDAQLRIFEVDESQIASAHPIEASTPEWSSIWLDALAEDAPDEMVENAPETAMSRPEAASLERRAMSCVVDTCLVGMGFLVFATAFAYNVAVLPSLAVAAMSSAAALAGMFAIYQLLFFTLSEATPGMRYARIGLCTFGEENPTRVALLGRIPATLLAACPLGLGFLWACLDEDGLGWHDRLSGMYQRSY